MMDVLMAQMHPSCLTLSVTEEQDLVIGTACAWAATGPVSAR